MSTKLHVANVPLDATEESLRSHFATVGGVADVELLFDARTNKPRGLARVTMTNDHYAEQARARLNGAPFGTAVLQVSDTPIKSNAEPVPRVKIVQQFREKMGMVYDLDCAGLPLTVRLTRRDENDWLVEARSTEAADAIVATGTATTGAAALAEALRAWNVAAESGTRPALDADAVATAMRNVRAI